MSANNKTDDKNGEDKRSYAEVFSDTASLTMAEQTTFLQLKALQDKKEVDPVHEDDNTVNGNNRSINLRSHRMTIMFSLPKQEDGKDYEAPLVAIEKMNAMISSLVNKLPKVRLGPWLSNSNIIKKK